MQIREKCRDIWQKGKERDNKKEKVEKIGKKKDQKRRRKKRENNRERESVYENESEYV